jgi:hypothetical protein
VFIAIHPATYRGGEFLAHGVLNPDFTLGKKLIFLIITFIGVGISIGIIYLSASLVLNKKLHGRSREIAMDLAFVDKVQRFFEMLIAGVSVLSFSCSYVIINHIYTYLSETTT